MTEDEARKALFEINLEYMSHPPKERLKLYDEYIKQRNEIKDALFKLKVERRRNEEQNKTYEKK